MPVDARLATEGIGGVLTVVRREARRSITQQPLADTPLQPKICEKCGLNSSNIRRDPPAHGSARREVEKADRVSCVKGAMF